MNCYQTQLLQALPSIIAFLCALSAFAQIPPQAASIHDYLRNSEYYRCSDISMFEGNYILKQEIQNTFTPYIQFGDSLWKAEIECGNAAYIPKQADSQGCP
jgi:hypothetical protein